MMWIRTLQVARASRAAMTLVSRRSLLRSFSTLPPHTVIGMPALSPTMEEGVIAAWSKNEGDAITPGDPLCEVETDKATVDFEMVDDGFLAKKLSPEGGPPIKVGAAIAIVVEDANDIAAFAAYSVEDNSAPPVDAPPPTSEPVTPVPTPAATPQSVQTMAKPESNSGGIFASPLARKVAAESNKNLSEITGTGPRGRILKADVEEHVSQASQSVQSTTSQAAQSSSVPGMYTDIAVPQNEIETALALAQRKKEVPHYYLNAELDVTELLQLREQLNSKLSEDTSISVNDFAIRAAAIAMQRYPDVNASWHETFIRQYKYCSINLATQTPNGVVFPVIHNVESKGLSAIAKEVRALQESVMSDSLAGLDLSYGTLTVTNLGLFGVKSVQPIISPQQGISLGLGAIVKEVVPGSEDGKFGTKYKIVASLSCDHRVVDGAVAAEWLQEFRTLIENPTTMLL